MSTVSFNSNETMAQILDRYGNMILRLAYSYLKNSADAEDVFQDVFIKLAEKNPLFENDTHEKAWLIRVTINLCKNKLRSPWRRLKNIEDTNEASVTPDLDQSSVVLGAVSTLPEKYREVVHLFYYEDYTTAQIAEILKKKEPTVRSLLFRARDMLRESLKEAYDFERSI